MGAFPQTATLRWLIRIYQNSNYVYCNLITFKSIFVNFQEKNDEEIKEERTKMMITQKTVKEVDLIDDDRIQIVVGRSLNDL